MTVIVEKIRDPNLRAGLAVAGKTCLALTGIALVQTASIVVVFSI